jgi:hypothetical protein
MTLLFDKLLGRWVWRKPVQERVPTPEPEPVAGPSWVTTETCSTWPMERKNHQAMIRGDAGEVRRMSGGRPDRGVWCDCCGGMPIAIFPMFNRLKHTVRLCEDCLSLGIGAIDNVERKLRNT